MGIIKDYRFWTGLVLGPILTTVALAYLFPEYWRSIYTFAMHGGWFFGLALLVILLLQFGPDYLMYVSARRRDKALTKLAQKFGLQLTLEYKRTDWTFKQPLSADYFQLRTLKGTINGNSVEISDRARVIKPLTPLANWRGMWGGPSQWWYFRFIPPNTDFFGYGAKTRISIDGKEEDLDRRGFWHWVSLASPGEIETLLKKI